MDLQRRYTLQRCFFKIFTRRPIWKIGFMLWFGIYFSGQLAFASGAVPIDVWKQIYSELPKQTQKQLLFLNHEWHQTISYWTSSLYIRFPNASLSLSKIHNKNADFLTSLLQLQQLKNVHFVMDRSVGIAELQVLFQLTQLTGLKLAVQHHSIKEWEKLAALCNLRSLKISHYYNMNAGFFDCLTALTQLRELSCKINADLLPNLSPKSCLTHLDLSNSKLSHPLPFEQLIHLKQFILRGCHIKCEIGSFLSVLTDLEMLDLYGWYCEHPATWGESIQHLSQLTDLDLRSLHCSSAVQLTTYVSTLFKLQRLALSGRENMKPEILHHLSELTALDMGYSSAFPEQGLFYISQCANLKKIHLPYMDQITASSLKHLTQFIKLQDLNLTHCCSISAIGWDYLSQLTNLTKLDLTRCSELLSLGLQYVLTLTRLRKLVLSHCQIAPKELQHLSHLTRLEMLDLMDCKPVRKQDLKYFSQLPRLHILCVEASEDAICKDVFSFLTSLHHITFTKTNPFIGSCASSTRFNPNK